MNTSPDKDTPKPAATVIILRDEPSYEVLMVTRHANMAFGASAWVFPGGKIGPADSASEWDDVVDGELPLEERAKRIGAAREVFEETGLLLARRPGEERLVDADVAEKLGEYRLKVEDEPELFVKLLKQEGLLLALDRLTPFAHWVTPKIEKRRYNTYFYIVRAPRRQVATHDGREAVDHNWAAPADVLKSAEKGEAKLMLPTRLNLEWLADASNCDEALNAAQTRNIVTVEPQLDIREDGAYLLLPKEAGYSIHEELVDAALGGAKPARP